MVTYKVVPDSLSEREPVKRGRTPTSELSIKLLKNQTVFVEGTKNLGSIYTLARNNGKRARTKRTVLNDIKGTLVWWEDIVEDSNKSAD